MHSTAQTPDAKLGFCVENLLVVQNTDISGDCVEKIGKSLIKNVVATFLQQGIYIQE